MLALVDARANAPEKQQEVLALVIDRETSNEVSRINREIGQSIYHHPPRHRFYRLNDWDRLTDEFGKAYDQGRATTLLGKDADYEHLLVEYTQLKLYLHGLRKSCYWHGDPYAEREDINVKEIMDRCDELKQMIKDRRRGIRYAAWGGMEPAKATAYDKPLLYAFDEYMCSHIFNNDSQGNEPTEVCPLKGEHWYHGDSYCRIHLGEARRSFKLKTRQARYEARHRRGKQLANCNEGCSISGPHAHTFSGVDRW